ncbi:MAG: calcium/sodium antiporter [Acidobacteria bacterium]|nr:calcium/sodium antiporter [Acidobacteriota bacterium]
MTDFLLLAASLSLLLLAARYFVDGISTIAESLGVPKIAIGMTVVAFGTSTPELVVNSISAYQGSTDLAFGNIVGSCLVNVGFVLGATALVRPMKVEHSLITREIPMLILTVATIVVLASDRFLNAETQDVWRRSDGLILLLLFCVFLYYTTRQAMAVDRSDPFIAEVSDEVARTKPKSLGLQILITIAGFIGVSLGANWTVEYAVSIARGFGVSETVIGLTVISLGTTLPELATCILAARRGDADIALGNIVGSNLFNLLCIGGIVSTIRPVTIPAGGHLDLIVMAFLSVVLLPIAIRSERTITRGEGSFLLVVFVTYLGYRVAGASL